MLREKVFLKQNDVPGIEVWSNWTEPREYKVLHKKNGCSWWAVPEHWRIFTPKMKALEMRVKKGPCTEKNGDTSYVMGLFVYTKNDWQYHPYSRRQKGPHDNRSQRVNSLVKGRGSENVLETEKAARYPFYVWSFSGRCLCWQFMWTSIFGRVQGRRVSVL